MYQAGTLPLPLACLKTGEFPFENPLYESHHVQYSEGLHNIQNSDTIGIDVKLILS